MERPGNNLLLVNFTVIGIYPAVGLWGIVGLSLAILARGTLVLVRRRT